MSSSIYSPLQFPDEIRLLILQPARSGVDSPPTWHMKHARLSENPRYEALSYVWDQVPYEEERSMASEERLGTNLSRALKHLRRVDEPDGRVLWIDALCVNQKDTNERNHQVTQMGEIYSNAESVIVWLGVGNSATRSAIAMLSTQASEDWIIDGHYKPPITTPWIRVPALLAFRALCRQKYWTRLWIIQEVLLATKIEVQWGDEVCQWSQLCWFLESLDTDWLRKYMENFYDIKFAIIKEIRASTAARLCKDWVDRKVKMSHTIDGKPVFSPLMALCSKYGSANCGDPRDKIFGLHSLAESCCRVEIPVDYDLKPAQIHRRVLEHCITRHERWDSIIGSSQSFHKQLKITLLAYLDRTGRQVNISSSWADITAVGYSASSIIYVYPVGHGSPVPTYFKALSVSRECREELSKLHKLRTAYGAEHFRNHLITRHFGLAVILSPKADYPFPAEKLRAPPLSSRRARKLKLDDVEQILADAQEVTSGMSTARLSIAISTSGVVYFVPDITRCGDIVCQVPSSDIVVIVRQGIHEPIGRAITFLSQPAEKPSQFEPSPMDIQALRKNDREVNLHLDLHTLQVLTACSAT